MSGRPKRKQTNEEIKEKENKKIKTTNAIKGRPKKTSKSAVTAEQLANWKRSKQTNKKIEKTKIHN
jgi:hypothetical protein